MICLLERKLGFPAMQASYSFLFADKICYLGKVPKPLFALLPSKVGVKDHCYDYLKIPISEGNGHRDSLPTDAIYLTFKVIG